MAARVVEALSRGRALLSPAPVDAGGQVAGSAATLAAVSDRVSSSMRTLDARGESARSYGVLGQQLSGRLSKTAGLDARLSRLLGDAADAEARGHRQSGNVVNAAAGDIARTAPYTNTAAGQLARLRALRDLVSEQRQVIAASKAHSAELAAAVRQLTYKDAPVQALDHDLPQSPAPREDPPHGKDPRYWIDVRKVIYIPEVTPAPPNYEQIGPDMWHPTPSTFGTITPPPDPVKYPLDSSDVRIVGPEELLPAGYRLVTPTIGLPDPDGYFQPQPPWTPTSPVDIRDIIHVGPGQLAPPLYREYLPGWWAPDPDAAVRAGWGRG